ncbi:MAG: hypothetical protein EOO39_00155 [Cytophagaceae bacterium]|nr:MAG: hypothetical protein EOO39_00155 [Cytophagaceae bacterium]
MKTVILEHKADIGDRVLIENYRTKDNRKEWGVVLRMEGRIASRFNRDAYTVTEVRLERLGPRGPIDLWVGNEKIHEVISATPEVNPSIARSCQLAEKTINASGRDTDEGEIETSIQDTISDLLHLAAKHDCDLTNVLYRAKMHFYAERKEEGLPVKHILA